ncbi:MAG TPA: MBL fold metallo-hydrolase [Longimicrobiales bacterium]|nr:MBL fold metallo-hydrolase [Longimicrobiales bacterium]
MKPRSLLAPNASPMTMAGTVTYVVGRRHAVILDPGSAADSHLAALATTVRHAEDVTIVLSHDHPDHSAGAEELAESLAAGDRGRVEIRSAALGNLMDGDVLPTDDGDLIALATPGHCPDHTAFHWPAADAVFCGDLMMGGLDTAVVAAPEGSIREYLESLERLRSLHPSIIYPSHGPAFTDPDAALDRYVAHRYERERQVLGALAGGALGIAEVTDRVYGSGLEPGLRPFAEAAVAAYLEHLRETGRLTGSATR